MATNRITDYWPGHDDNTEHDAEWKAKFERTAEELNQAREDLAAGRITEEEFDERF